MSGQSTYISYLKPGLSGKLFGSGHDIANGVPEGVGRTAFGLLLAKGSMNGRVRMPALDDTIVDLAGVFKYTHIYPRSEDGSIGIPQFRDGDLIRKGKIYLPAETGLLESDGALYWQIVEESGNSRYVGFLYPTASATPANNVDVSSVVTVHRDEANGHAIYELFIR